MNRGVIIYNKYNQPRKKQLVFTVQMCICIKPLDLINLKSIKHVIYTYRYKIFTFRMHFDNHLLFQNSIRFMIQNSFFSTNRNVVQNFHFKLMFSVNWKLELSLLSSANTTIRKQNCLLLIGVEIVLNV